MSTIPFKVFPSKGYRNSQYQLTSFVDAELTITIEHNGNKTDEITLPNNGLGIINRLIPPGSYSASAIANGKIHKQSFEVMDSIRIGSSSYKAAYTFKNIPYSFFIQKDRMLIWDEGNQKFLEENQISPSDIKAIDNSHLLFITELDTGKKFKKITNYAIYSLLEFQIIFELVNDFKDISHQNESKVLWVYNFKEHIIQAINIDSASSEFLSTIATIENITRYAIVNAGLFVYAETNETIYTLDLRTVQIKEYSKDHNLAIRKDGTLLTLKGETLSCSFIFDDKADSFDIPTPKALRLNELDFFYMGNHFNAPIDESSFKLEADAFSDNYIKKFGPEKTILLKTKIVEEKVPEMFYGRQQLFIANRGVLILEKRTRVYIDSISARKKSDDEWDSTCYTDEDNKFYLSFHRGSMKKTLYRDIAELKVLHYSYPLLIIKLFDYYAIVQNDIPIKNFEKGVEHLFINTSNGMKYHIKKKEEGQRIFSISDNRSTLILKDIEILNQDYLNTHEVIWYRDANKKQNKPGYPIRGYDLKTGKPITISELSKGYFSFTHDSTPRFYDSYMLNRNLVIIDAKTGAVKDATLGIILSVSEDLNKVISRRNDIIYLHTYNPKLEKYESTEIPFSKEKIQESYLSPNGNFLVLKKDSNAYVLFDIEKNTEINFFSGKFLAFSKEGNLIIEQDARRSARIFDPLTFEDITPPNYHYYRFMSPDGKLYSQVAMKVKYYHRVEERYIEAQELGQLRTLYNDPLSEQDKIKLQPQIDANRQMYFEKNKEKLKQLKVESPASIKAGNLVETQKYTEIGIVGTQVTAEIRFPIDLQFYNYAAFSYDNRYFGYVGKPDSKGLIHLFMLEFDDAKQKLAIAAEYRSRYPGYASWVCGFSKTNYFATYDSTPDTYIIRLDDDIYTEKTSEVELKKELKVENNTYRNVYKNWIEIKGKNFMCFSPSGEFMAISNMGYDPITLGGSGHQESSSLHVARTDNGKLIFSFLEHGERIMDDKSSKLVFVAFSEDESKLMSMSADGVVIVRNINIRNL